MQGTGEEQPSEETPSEKSEASPEGEQAPPTAEDLYGSEPAQLPTQAQPLAQDMYQRPQEQYQETYQEPQSFQQETPVQPNVPTEPIKAAAEQPLIDQPAETLEFQKKLNGPSETILENTPEDTVTETPFQV